MNSNITVKASAQSTGKYTVYDSGKFCKFFLHAQELVAIIQTLVETYANPFKNSLSDTLFYHGNSETLGMICILG